MYHWHCNYGNCFFKDYLNLIGISSRRLCVMFKPPGVQQGSPGRRLCSPVWGVRSVSQIPPSPPSPCLQTTKEAVGPTSLTATSSRLSSSAHFWSGLFENKCIFVKYLISFLHMSLLFFSKCVACFVTSRCWTCLWLSLWITLSIWHETPRYWVPITWTSLYASGESMTAPHGEAC